MLTDEEWEEIYPLIRFDIERIKNYRASTGTSVKEAISAIHGQALDRYFEMTGFLETNINALEHHQISQYGDECLSWAFTSHTEGIFLC